MAQMAAAIFDTREDAQRAVHALRDHGVEQESISVLAVADDGSGKVSNLDENERVPAPGKDEGISTTTPEDAARGAADGSIIGAGLGLAAALASIFVPGFGLVTAGGALATALMGAAAATAGGAVAGGVTGYLADMGVPHETAHSYENSLKKGGVLVSVHDTTEATNEEIHQIFVKYNGREGGSFTGLAGGNVSNPSELDATNSRLTEGGAGTAVGNVMHTGQNIDPADHSLSAAGLVARDGDSLDAVSGSEGSASSRLSNDDARMAGDNLDSGVTPRTADLGSTSVGSTAGIGLAGNTTRNMGDAPLGDPTTGTLGRAGDSMGISSDIGTTAGYTGTGTGGSDMHVDRGAEAAGTAGGASAGANDGGMGDFEDNSRPEGNEAMATPRFNLDDTTQAEPMTDDDDIDSTMSTRSGATSGGTTGGTTNTGTTSGGSGIGSSGGT